MAYSPQTWENDPSTASPLSAARLNTMEDGIAGAVQSSDLDTAVAGVMPTDFSTATAIAIHNLFISIWAASGLTSLSVIPADAVEDLSAAPMAWSYFAAGADNSPFPASAGFAYTVYGDDNGDSQFFVAQVAYPESGGAIAYRASTDKSGGWPSWIHLVASGDLAAVATSGSYTDLDDKPTIPAAVTYGSSAGTACEGNDSRLSNARTPTAHTHAAADVNSGTLAYARLPVGITANTVAAGNDSRITGAVQSGAAGSVVVGSLPGTGVAGVLYVVP